MNSRVVRPFRALSSALLISVSLAIPACGGGGDPSPDPTDPDYVEWNGNSNGVVIKDGANASFAVLASSGTVVALASNTRLNGLTVSVDTAAVSANGTVIGGVVTGTSTTGGTIAEFECSGPPPRNGPMTISLTSSGWTYSCVPAGSSGGGNPTATPYGALAVNATTLDSGIAYDYSTQTAADQAALAQCGGGACGVVEDMVGAGVCASYAASSDRAWGAAVGASLAQAQAAALATCSSHGGTSCSTQLSACN